MGWDGTGSLNHLTHRAPLGGANKGRVLLLTTVSVSSEELLGGFEFIRWFKQHQLKYENFLFLLVLPQRLVRFSKRFHHCGHDDHQCANAAQAQEC